MLFRSLMKQIMREVLQVVLRKENENTPFDILLHRHKGLDDKDTSKLVLSLAIDYHPATELQLKSTP